MATKNNPKNRGKISTKKQFNGKDIEPILVVDNGTKYMGAKYSKTTNVICDDKGSPIPWQKVVNG